MIIASLAPLLLMQVGPAGSIPVDPLPVPRKPPAETAVPRPSPPPGKMGECLDLVRTDPAAAAAMANEWRATTTGLERASAGRCLGVAQSAQGLWAEAATSFAVARADVPTVNTRYRARLGALAGAAALAAGDHAQALSALDDAVPDAGSSGELLSGIQTDRARALVALERPVEAASALSEARRAWSANATAWLLSATLSRRNGDLAAAQAQIEEAAKRDRLDPEIGLEAGVIAALAGNADAARASWNSVLALAPDSESAARARSYIAQLDAPE